VPSPLTEPLLTLADAWRSATTASRRRIAVVAVALAWVMALLVARHGTAHSRIAAAAIIGASLAMAVAWRVLERRGLREPARIVRWLVRGLDQGGSDRALRALSLVGPDGNVRGEGTSTELARLHVARAIARLPSELVIARATRRAARVGALGLVFAACVLGIVLAQARPVLEGADVLVARRGVAPVTIRWLEEVTFATRPPDYLREAERHAIAFTTLALPYGTVLTVRGVPLHTGRLLLLSDGATEVPFVDDGAGAVVARWSLTASTTLRVAARFGDVTIVEPDALVAESVPDRPPTVVLEGAPRQVSLVDQGEDSLPIRYEADDDHGLREVHLVLRSGTREERRVLSHLDGQTKTDKGGYVLKLRESFLRKSHAPIEVTVEAKDNDSLTGPKWGASPAITLVPPDVGEPEARRLDALRHLRDSLVDSLAWRLSNPPPRDARARTAFVASETRRAANDDTVLTRTLPQSYGGVRIPLRVRATLTAQQEKTRKALDHELKAPSTAAHAEVLEATERFVLVVDAVVRGLGVHDARESARQLADVADDLALGASQMHNDGASPGGSGPVLESAEARSRGAARMDAATAVLSGGGAVMKRLGALGRDLGEIIDADLLRVNRARGVADFVHTELAARDLAARLREPDPSFGAHGGSVGRAGGESGGARGTPGDERDVPDDLDQAFQEAAKSVEQLAQDHAGEIGKMEQALAGATSDEELEQLRQESKRHAEAIREAARALPTVGNGSDSWTSKGAAARELAEQMARSLEKAQTEDAVHSGRNALGALDEAERMLRSGRWIDDPSGEEKRRVADTHRKLDLEELWAQKVLEQMRKRAAERARKQLQRGGEEEGKLADRARDLARQARDRGSLPQQAVESIDDAAHAARQAEEALGQGDAERGLDRQREAQRNLEAAKEQLRGDDDDVNGGSRADPQESDARWSHQLHGNVPPPGEHKGPEDFRRRVVRGLGQPAGGALKDAVRRYAEGLLR
jgi:hypothetical protein